MNLAQALSLTRALIILGSGILVTYGYVTEDVAAQIGGAITTVVPIIWGIFAHTDKAKIAAAETVRTVEKIVVSDPKVATAAGDKVISAAAAALTRWP